MSAPLITALNGKRDIMLVDIGASEGEFTMQVQRFCGIGRALLIEPQPSRCEQLRRKFSPPDYAVVCSAVGESERSMEMEVLRWDYSSSILPVIRNRPEVNAMIDLNVRELIRCRVATLDKICSEQQFDGDVDLLKVDVQGAEHLVLAGARMTLRKTKLLWAEVSFQPLYEGSVTIEGLIKICREHGFLLKHLSEGFRGANGELLQADALFVPGGS